GTQLNIIREPNASRCFPNALVGWCRPPVNTGGQRKSPRCCEHRGRSGDPHNRPTIDDLDRWPELALHVACRERSPMAQSTGLTSDMPSHFEYGHVPSRDELGQAPFNLDAE